MNVRQVLKILKNDGWYKVSQEGSHRHFKHPEKKGKVTVPIQNGELGKGTLNSILTQAGLKEVL